MFDFQKLQVYQKALHFNAEVRKLLKEKEIDQVLKNQLNRASSSIVLNIAEGSGRFSKRDRRNFFVIARSSLFECVSLFDLMLSSKQINTLLHNQLSEAATVISKMLFTMVRGLEG